MLTGSTGAGKSLILSAVNLLLGERASTRVIRAGRERAMVEAVFQLSQPISVTAHWGECVTLRREVHANGRSHCFIDDKPCTVKQLQEISRQLIEPHGQNEQIQLKDPATHLIYLDTFARNDDARAAYAAALESYSAARKRVADFDAKVALLREKKELIEHRLEEIERARLEAGEKEELEEQVTLLEHARDIFEALTRAGELAYDDESSAASLTAQARAGLDKLADIDPKLKAFAEQLRDAEIQLQETAREMRAWVDGLDFEPGRLAEMQERIEYLKGLERRYRMPIDELVEEKEEWRAELESLAFEDEEREKLRKEKSYRVKALARAAQALRATRKEAALVLDKRMTQQLEELMMPGARFRTGIDAVPDPASDLRINGDTVTVYADGIDRVEFRVRTNQGEAEGNVAEIASSGELSRIALALKEVVSMGREGSVLIFDELDAGIGADLGEMIARKVLAIADGYQIICITHMPQIAARGRHHLVVSKGSHKGRTYVTVEPVDGDDREREIARMLGGKEGSAKRIALAREMLQPKKTTSHVRP